jgi:hypothetical protein
MADHAGKWPFAPTDGKPESRPLVVDLENVLVVLVADDAAAERAVETLRGLGFTDENLRLYTSEQIVAYDEAFRSGRGLKDRVVGALVDDRGSMAEYVNYARAGSAALWIHVGDRDEANRLVRHLADDEIMYLWFHGTNGLESMRVN